MNGRDMPLKRRLQTAEMAIPTQATMMPKSSGWPTPPTVGIRSKASLGAVARSLMVSTNRSMAPARAVSSHGIGGRGAAGSAGGSRIHGILL